MQRRKLIRNASYIYSPFGRGGAVGWFVGFDVLGRRFGFDRSTVLINGDRYLDRWILYVAGYTLRLHRFWRGDDDRASHTHPWWFITFPLTSYIELVYHKGKPARPCMRNVTAWRFHYRPANYEHFVLGRQWWWASRAHAPWWTIVLTGPKQSSWGFYPFDDTSTAWRQATGKFVNWKDWT